MGQQITDIIHSTTQWGSLPLNMVELIQKAAEGRIDYRNALRAFRSSILSQKRHLTRMYPSRRFASSRWVAAMSLLHACWWPSTPVGR